MCVYVCGIVRGCVQIGVVAVAIVTIILGLGLGLGLQLEDCQKKGKPF